MDVWQAIGFTETSELVALAQEAELCGYAGVALPDHLVTPGAIESPYPYTRDGRIWWDPRTHMPDPLVMAGVIASHTTTLRLLTAVYVLPLHELFGVAKAVSTVAYLAEDRLVLGAGVGWMAEEFALTGQPFANRGRRTDEMLEILSGLMRGGPLSHDGEFYRFDALSLAPVPERPVPVYVGGNSDAALRRAARHDGWLGAGHDPAELPAVVDRLLRYRRAEGLGEEDFDVVTYLTEVPQDLDVLRRLADAGVTGIVTPWFDWDQAHAPLTQKLDAIRRFADDYARPLREIGSTAPSLR
ncbi:TIGR03619 family F420-dependent LLM class oxidoreductase [Nocardioides sp. KR10-350]|uniref:TIGR03619 family F420-dependent LLM class oxidoreductase n=1 Tax=Nocardioides cheoyonin TaxID=3156615 RepID=UPI0032B3BAEF